MTCRLHVNIDHVATLRNQRDTPYPDVLEAARLCLEAGAQGITVHLREDRRHIRDADVVGLRRAMSRAPGGPMSGTLNLEMAATTEMARIAGELRPDVVTLVPEKREERTTEGGLDLKVAQSKVEEVARVCRAAQVRMSLFIEADPVQIRLARELGADQVEFHTGHYAERCLASSEFRAQPDVAEFASAATLAHQLGMEVAAGHGLTTQNVAPLLAIPHLVEFNIGHAIVSDAVMVGLSAAVAAMRRALTCA